MVMDCSTIHYTDLVTELKLALSVVHTICRTCIYFDLGGKVRGKALYHLTVDI